ncbi:MAG: hypothetical protein PHG23_03730, partial [Candidatus Pacebacteria bacterium]|nr:hypothetical protein [Candidatus Paceibacterota bacterium]
YQSNKRDPSVKGLKPHSGHVMGTRESFLPFHWIIYPNGSVYCGLQPTLMRIGGDLAPYQVAWSLGNWETDCESLSMAFVLDGRQRMPTMEQIKTANVLIEKARALVPDVTVAPHYQFDPHTNCPGWEFEKWREKLH